MLVIRQEQMRVFERAVTERFVEDTVDYLMRQHRGTVGALSREAATTLVRDGIGRARGYGVEETGSVREFIELMLTIHPEFDMLPDLEDVREVLHDHGLSGEAKMSLVCERMRGAVRA